MITLDYLNLITSEHRDKPNFTAMISLDVSTMVQVQELLMEMVIPLYDVDTAVGQQLDVIGIWVGFSRNVQVPLLGVFFEWDGSNPYVGWDYGIWQDEDSPAAITILPDDVYRKFIKAKIAANHWDGTTDGAYEVWSEAFPDIELLIQDGLDMSYKIAFVGGIVDALTAAVIIGGYLPLKPEGVRISEYLFPVNDGPLFAWDVENTFLAGWDDGSWPRVITPT